MAEIGLGQVDDDLKSITDEDSSDDDDDKKDNFDNGVNEFTQTLKTREIPFYVHTSIM